MQQSFQSLYEDIREKFQPELEQVIATIDRVLACDDQSVNELLSHFRSARGKMLRPLVMLCSARTCGNINSDHIHVAAIFEIMHNATLLHDDVIDHGLIRRQRPTVNRLWGNEPAVLLGDFLFTRAFKSSLRLPAWVSENISDTLSATCRGEIHQDIARQKWNMPESEYIEIITDKSARLFQSCGYLATRLAGADEELSCRLGKFGLHLGIAYQASDDVLDLTGEHAQIDKTPGRDVASLNITLPLISLLDQLDSPQKQRIIERLRGNSINRAELRELMSSYRCFDYVYNFSRAQLDQALQQLKALPQNHPTAILEEIAELISARSRQSVETK